MKESKFALKSGLGAGLLAVLCCVGPVILVLLGFGGASVLFGLDQYKPYFIAAGLLVLAGASWYAVRKRNRCCTTSNKLKDIQVVALIFAVGIGSYLFLHYMVVPALSNVAANNIESRHNSPAPTEAVFPTLELRVEGMSCAGCAVGVKQALLDVPGVKEAEVDWQTGNVSVVYDPSETNIERILQAKVQDNYLLLLEDKPSGSGSSSK